MVEFRRFDVFFVPVVWHQFKYAPINFLLMALCCKSLLPVGVARLELCNHLRRLHRALFAGSYIKAQDGGLGY